MFFKCCYCNWLSNWQLILHIHCEKKLSLSHFILNLCHLKPMSSALPAPPMLYTSIRSPLSLLPSKEYYSSVPQILLFMLYLQQWGDSRLLCLNHPLSNTPTVRCLGDWKGGEPRVNSSRPREALSTISPQDKGEERARGTPRPEAGHGGGWGRDGKEPDPESLPPSSAAGGWTGRTRSPLPRPLLPAPTEPPRPGR